MMHQKKLNIFQHHRKGFFFSLNTFAWLRRQSLYAISGDGVARRGAVGIQVMHLSRHA